MFGTAAVVRANGEIALWSGGQASYQAAAQFSLSAGAKMGTQTFAGKTLTFASHFIPKVLSRILWNKLSAEFVAGATSAMIYVNGAGIYEKSTFWAYEIWVLLEKSIERSIEYLGG